MNVVGALLSPGELFATKLWVTMTAMLFVCFLGLLMAHVGNRLMVGLDNATTHVACAKPTLPSGSMQGEPLLKAKALLLAIANILKQEGRRADDF